MTAGSRRKLLQGGLAAPVFDREGGVVGAHSMISVGVAYVWPYTSIAIGNHTMQHALAFIEPGLWLLTAH